MSIEEITPKYPDIEVKLTGTDSNAFSIIAKVAVALRKGGAPREDQEAFSEEARSGSYDELIQTAMRWVSVS